MQTTKSTIKAFLVVLVIVATTTVPSVADTQFVGNVYIDGNLIITNGGGAALVSADTSAYLRVYGYGTSEVSGAAASIEGFNDGWAESASYGSVIEGCNEGDATVGSLAAGSRIEGYNAGWSSVVFPGSKEQGYNLGMRDVNGRGIVIGGYNSSGGDQLASGNGSTIDGYNLGSNLVTGSGSSIEGYTASGAAQISGGTTGEAGGTKTAGMVKSGYTNEASANGAWAVGSDVHATNEYSYVFGDGRRSYRSNSLSVANIDVDTLYGSDGNPIDVASLANAGQTTNASALTAGTLDDARLSTNVVILSSYPDLDLDGTDDLLLSGGTMSGPLTAPAITATTFYADSAVINGLLVDGEVTASDGFIGSGQLLTNLPQHTNSVKRTGDTMTGSLTVNQHLKVDARSRLSGWTYLRNTNLATVITDSDSRPALIFGATDTVQGWFLGPTTSTVRDNTIMGLYSWSKGWVQTWNPNGSSVIHQGSLSVAGEVYSTTNGFRFPDGSVQTTAATNSLASYVKKAGDTMTGTLTVPDMYVGGDGLHIDGFEISGGYSGGYLSFEEGLLNLAGTTIDFPGWSVTDTNRMTNMNADMLDGRHATGFTTSGDGLQYVPRDGDDRNTLFIGNDPVEGFAGRIKLRWGAVWHTISSEDEGLKYDGEIVLTGSETDPIWGSQSNAVLTGISTLESQMTNTVSKTGDTITGSLTVSGAVYMAYVPAQGDISMGVYTNGMP